MNYSYQISIITIYTSTNGTFNHHTAFKNLYWEIKREKTELGCFYYTLLTGIKSKNCEGIYISMPEERTHTGCVFRGDFEALRRVNPAFWLFGIRRYQNSDHRVLPSRESDRVYRGRQHNSYTIDST